MSIPVTLKVGIHWSRTKEEATLRPIGDLVRPSYAVVLPTGERDYQIDLEVTPSIGGMLTIYAGGETIRSGIFVSPLDGSFVLSELDLSHHVQIMHHFGLFIGLDVVLDYRKGVKHTPICLVDEALSHVIIQDSSLGLVGLQSII